MRCSSTDCGAGAGKGVDILRLVLKLEADDKTGIIGEFKRYVGIAGKVKRLSDKGKLPRDCSIVVWRFEHREGILDVAKVGMVVGKQGTDASVLFHCGHMWVSV